MLHENFYFMVFIRHPASKIWSSICMQDSVRSALYYPQPAIECSKLTIETLKQGVKYVQS